MKETLSGFYFRTSCGQANIVLQATPMGKDLAISIFGGQCPHIGAVALAQPRPSLRDPDCISATASVITLSGHKEDMLARNVANRVAATASCVVSVSCRIHYEAATPEQICEIEIFVQTLTVQLLQVLQRQRAADLK